MKAEHRKALQTNTLADVLGRTMQSARGGIGFSWFWVFLVLFVGAVVWLYFGVMKPNWARAEAESWARLDYNDQASIQMLVKDYRDTKVGRAARLTNAYQFEWKDIQNLGSSNPAKIQEALAEAMKVIDYLESVAEDCKDDKEFLAEAKYHIAVTEESLAVIAPEFLEKAKKHFEEGSQGDLAKTAYGIMAKRRLDQYNNPTEFEVIDRFYKEYQVRSQLGRLGP